MSAAPNAPSALVTGGSRGIGRGIALRLAQRGWGVTIAARGAEALDDCVRELISLGSHAIAVAGDISDDQHVTGLIERHLDAFGGLDALVLAAGVGSAGPLAGYPARRLDRQIDVNFRGPFLMTAAALPSMRATAQRNSAGVARVIALSSLEGIHPESGLAAYGATKAALISLVNSINAEERVNGVTATAIAPGYVDTEMSDWISDVIPKASMLSVDDITRCVELLLDLSPQAVIPQIVLTRRDAPSYQA
jgi:3-oxoacyl-[acyl-carrier protein] reductase